VLHTDSRNRKLIVAGNTLRVAGGEAMAKKELSKCF